MHHEKLRRSLAALTVVTVATALALTALADILPGDISGDGKVTAFDAQALAEAQAGHRTLTEDQQAATETLTPGKILDIVLGRETESDDSLAQLAADYERYINMSGAEQAAYLATFDSVEAFFEWYTTAKEAYETLNPDIEIGGDGSVDLGGIK